MGKRENKFQSSENLCNNGKMSSSVPFHQYFQVFQDEVEHSFSTFGVAINEFFSFRRLQYDVNNLGTRFLSSCHWNFWWIPS